jgi:uncharacterized protein (TIGR03067 family)
MTPTLLALVLAVAAPVTKDKEPPKKEPTIVGEWAGEKAEAAGMALPVPVGGMTMEFKGDGTLVIKDAGKPPEEARYTADPKKEPAEIDLTPPAAGGKVEKLAGIYKVEGDTLTLCLAAVGERPKKFESAAGAPTILMTFKRAKKKD